MKKGSKTSFGSLRRKISSASSSKQSHSEDNGTSYSFILVSSFSHDDCHY